ncbi:MAG TPA: glycosyltransferase [Ktedonobacteraceae bacterium]|jgi:GT2 family glycosyltransferase|nr:glycosyltransferase [Ktedonobacteraceae bacterium]
MALQSSHHAIPEDILALSHERDSLRKKGKYARADELKQQIEEAGYGIKDNPHGAHLVILPSVEIDGEVYRTTGRVPSLLQIPDRCLFSVNVLARNNFEQVRRCIESILRFAGEHTFEIMLVDNASQDEVYTWAKAAQGDIPNLHILRISRQAGEAEARNIGLKQSTGKYILLLEANIELNGDVFTPLLRSLSSGTTGITGLHGLLTDDLRHFEESSAAEVEAISAACMAFPRKLLRKTGLFDERYRFPYYMDIDFNFAVRDTGVRAVVTPDLPLVCHPAQQRADLSDAERTRLIKRNYYRFLQKWGQREDLLLED